MKKLLVIAAIAASSAVFADKIGTVDMSVLLRNHSGYASNKRFLENTEKDYQKRLDAMKSELDAIQEEGKKLADEYRSPMLAQTAKTKLEGQLTEVQERYIRQQQKMRDQAMRDQQELAGMESRFLKDQAADIKAHIKKFAERNGYDLVIDAAAALYAKPEADVTDGVLAEMGVDPAKAVRNLEASGEGK